MKLTPALPIDYRNLKIGRRTSNYRDSQGLDEKEKKEGESSVALPFHYSEQTRPQPSHHVSLTKTKMLHESERLVKNSADDKVTEDGVRPGKEGGGRERNGKERERKG